MVLLIYGSCIYLSDFSRMFDLSLRVPICEGRSHAAKLVPSALDRSRRSRRNFTRVTVLAAATRNSGKVLRRAIATTSSEGASPGRTVRIQDPKDRQTN